MKRETFAKKIQTKMGEKEDESLTNGEWQKHPYKHIYKNMEDNFIDKSSPKNRHIKGDEIKYHTGAAHMNSSQVMCINFFKKFFEKESNEEILLDLLREYKFIIPKDTKIKEAIFEYEKDYKEGTNFDFYLILSNKKTISFEIKYTESEFGSISKTGDYEKKYNKKWEEIYQSLVENSTYLKEISKDYFYENYQINRNIVFANDGDIVIFLTPENNYSAGIKNGRDYIDSMENRNIKNLYWEDIVKKLLELVKGNKELEAYYGKFNEKYIDILVE